MRILRRILVSVAVLVVVLIAAAAGVYVWQQPILLTGTGYAAHNGCAVTEIAERDDPQDDLPPNPLVPYFQVESVESEGRTTATIPAGLARQDAWFTPGFGCTLADARPDLGSASQIDPEANPFRDVTPPPASPALVEAMARSFGADMSKTEADALGTRGVVIVKNGEVVAEQYAEGFDASTPQLGWSMSKSIATLITGMLVQQGKVSLDDDHLRPEWTDERAEIDIENLLRMDSGIEWDETYELGTPITRMLYLEEDMGAYVASLPLQHAPGTVQEYSSGSTTLLCAVLAERTGFGADLPRKTILGALGLSSAVFEPDAVGTPVCSSYLWATPRDWAVLGQFALQDGEWNGEQLMPEGWMAQSLTVTEVSETDDDGYGMGFRINARPDGSFRWPELPADTYYMSGHDGQLVLIVPSEDLVVVRMGFTPVADEEASVVQLVAEAIAELHSR